MGWLGDLFIVIGIYLLGKKDKRAFLFSIVGESFWIWAAVLRQDWALAFICLVFNLGAFRNYLLWRKVT